jgi:hypothetical protein
MLQSIVGKLNQNYNKNETLLFYSFKNILRRFDLASY